MRITTRRGDPWITVPARVKQPEPVALDALTRELPRQSGTLDLLDVFKEAAHLTGCLDEFTSVASRA